MISLLQIVLAVVLFLAGWFYLYRPALIIRFNAWCREALLSDTMILEARRKIGLLSILLSALLFYSALSGPEGPAPMGPRIERMAFEEAQQAFQARNYSESIGRCQALIRQRPNHVGAWQLLGASWLAMGQKIQARRAWERVLQLDPRNPVKNSRLLTGKGQ